MNSNANRVAILAAGMALCLSGSVFAAQTGEQDSAYRWGRWAVLSPAAGGVEPYVQAATPGADFNARPGDAPQFQPNVTVDQSPPPVDDPRDRPSPIVTDDPRDRPAPSF